MTDQEILQLLLTKMTSFEEKMEGLKGDFQGLKGDVQGLKGDVEGLKGDVQGLKTDVKELQEGQKELLNGQKIIREQVVKNSEEISQLATKQDFEKLNNRLEYQYIRISKVEENIHFAENVK